VTALLLVDHRGVELNWEDLTHPLPKGNAREDLKALRSAARRGDIPVAVYRRRHTELWNASRKGADKLGSHHQNSGRTM
jgi:hypothetical protein